MMLNLSEKGRIKKKLCALKKRGLTFFSYCYLLFPFSEHLKLKTSECRRGFSSSFFFIVFYVSFILFLLIHFPIIYNPIYFSIILYPSFVCLSVCWLLYILYLKSESSFPQIHFSNSICYSQS